MMIFSIKLPFSSSLAVDEEPKNDSLMSNLETNLASFDTGPPSISLLTPDTHLGVENLNGWVWCDQPSSLLACTITWSHHVTLHNVTLTCLTSYSLSGARELKVKLPVNMTPSCLVTTCHTLHNVYWPLVTWGHSWCSCLPPGWCWWSTQCSLAWLVCTGSWASCYGVMTHIVFTDHHSPVLLRSDQAHHLPPEAVLLRPGWPGPAGNPHPLWPSWRQ